MKILHKNEFLSVIFAYCFVCCNFVNIMRTVSEQKRPTCMVCFVQTSQVVEHVSLLNQKRTEGIRKLGRI